METTTVRRAVRPAQEERQSPSPYSFIFLLLLAIFMLQQGWQLYQLSQARKALQPWIGDAVQALAKEELIRGANIVAKLPMGGELPGGGGNEKDDRLLQQVGSLSGALMLDCLRGASSCEGIAELLDSIAKTIPQFSNPNLQAEVGGFLCWLTDVVAAHCCPGIWNLISYSCNAGTGEIHIRIPDPRLN